jgi:hemolysin activation/secretion protein
MLWRTRLTLFSLGITPLALANAQSTASIAPLTLSPTYLAAEPARQAQQVQSLPRDPANPDSDFLQPTAPPQPVEPVEIIPILPSGNTPNSPTDSPATPSVTIPVQRIEVTGSSIFKEADFAPLVQPFEGKSLSLEALRQVADSVTQLYLDAGFITSRAVLVDQVITNGLVQIRVIEGSLETIEIEGNQRVRSSYIRSRVRLGSRTPLNQAKLEDQLRLLRLDPLFENVEASLRAGSGLGQSILTVRVTEANGLIGGVSADNYSTPTVGSERTGASLGYRNVTGNGDTFLGSYYRSTTGGSNQFDLSYQLPINAMNGTVLLRFAPDNYRITSRPPGFGALNIEGNAETYELSFRQPLVRSPREEFALSIGLTHRDGETLINDFLVDNSTTSVIKFGQDYTRRDLRGAWSLRSQFSFGMGFLNATSGSEPNGQFFSGLGQIQRVQILNSNNLLIVQADLQLTPDPLLSSQQFVMGGGQSLRGYRQNVRAGDNGFRLSIEDRLTLARNATGASIFQLRPFIDVGAVWNVGSDRPLPRQNFLVGAGVGFLWEPMTNLNLRFDYALPLIDLSDRGENAQDQGIYFSVNYQL